MSSFKCFVVALGIVVGSEVIFKCLKHIYNLFIHPESRKMEYENLLCIKNENQRIFSRVIFFPDQGIISGNLHRVQDINSHDLSMPVKEGCDFQLQCTAIEVNPNPSTSHLLKRIFFPYDQTSFMGGKKSDRCVRKENSSGCDSPECNLKRNCNFSPESMFQKQSITIHCNGKTKSSVNDQLQNSGSSSTGVFLPSGYLQMSTSLIHIINVLESAKRSLVICLYVLTCKDLIDAIVRAKQRGVRVRVLLEKGMANYGATVSILHEHQVLFRLSNPALLMHHKFAIVDASEQPFESPDGMCWDVNRNNGEYSDMSHKYRISRDDKGKDTGSFVQSRFSDQWRCRIPNKNSELQYFTIPRPLRKIIPHPHNIFDGVLMTGSFNWTWSAVVNNNENVVITNNPHLIMKYFQEFETLWKNLEVKAAICKY